jgi:hypothetical protein
MEEIEWNPEKPHSDYAISKYGARKSGEVSKKG